MSDDNMKYNLARDLIRERKLDEARQLLETIDHPKAQKLLERLSQRTPVSKPNRFPLTIFAIIVIISLAWAITLLTFNFNHNQENLTLPTRVIINNTQENHPSVIKEITEAAENQELSSTFTSTSETIAFPTSNIEPTVENILLPNIDLAITPETTEEISLAFNEQVILTSDNWIYPPRNISQTNSTPEEKIVLPIGVYAVSLATNGLTTVGFTTTTGNCNDADNFIIAQENMIPYATILRTHDECGFDIVIRIDQEDTVWELTIEELKAENAQLVADQYTGEKHGQHSVIGPLRLQSDTYYLDVNANGEFTLDIDVLDGNCIEDINMMYVRPNQVSQVDSLEYESQGCVVIFSITASDSNWTLHVNQ